jgi:hypothetical protein
MTAQHELACALCATWTTVSIAFPLALTLSEPLCPTTILGTFIVPSGLRYYNVLRWLRKMEFGGASVFLVLMVVGAVLERVWKCTTETWAGAGFPGLAVGGGVGRFGVSFYA